MEEDDEQVEEVELLLDMHDLDDDLLEIEVLLLVVDQLDDYHLQMDEYEVLLLQMQQVDLDEVDELMDEVGDDEVVVDIVVDELLHRVNMVDDEDDRIMLDQIK